MSDGMTYLESFKCSECHHEWQAVDGDPSHCDWCGAPGYQLVELDSIGGAKLQVWYMNCASYDNQRYMEACDRGYLDV